MKKSDQKQKKLSGRDLSRSLDSNASPGQIMGSVRQLHERLSALEELVSKKQGGRPAPLPPSSMGREVGTVKNEAVNGFLVLVGIASTGVLLSFGAFYLGVFLKGLL